MTFEAVRQNIIDRRAGGLLELLPAHENMKWRTYSIKDPQAVLVIGCLDDYELLACKERASAGQFTLQYCSQRSNEVVRSWLTTEIAASAVEQDMVVDLPLAMPFKYSANSSPTSSGQSDLSVLIQWYFLGREDNDIVCNIDEYCTMFHKALRNIESQLVREGSLNISIPPTRVDDACKAPGSPEVQCTPVQGWFTPPKGQSPGATGDRDPVYEQLIDLLGKPNLDDFVHEENPLPNARPQKLLVGHCRDTELCIYAYMREWGGHYRVELYVEDSKRRTQLKTTDVAKHVVYHPFDKTYAKNCQNIGKDGKLRLSLLIKWYFVVAGVVDGGVLKEMYNYPERLRSMLQWVQGRMHAAAQVDSCEEDFHGDVTQNEDSEKALSPIEEGPCTPIWESTNDTTSHVTEIEELTRSIVEHVTKHVAEEKSKDQQDERRLVEIDRELRKFKTERGRIEKRQEWRTVQLREADTAIKTWMNSRSGRTDP